MDVALYEKRKSLFKKEVTASLFVSTHRVAFARKQGSQASEVLARRAQTSLGGLIEKRHFVK
jgi:hypothetical protein